MSHSRRGYRGFTLIEMLVTISIIALLVALLMPVISNARNVAFKAKCGSNMRQLGVYVAMYEHDFRVIMPWFLTDPNFPSYSPPSYWHGWGGHHLLFMAGYMPGGYMLSGNDSDSKVVEMRSRNVLLCPSGTYTNPYSPGYVGYSHYGEGSPDLDRQDGITYASSPLTPPQAAGVLVYSYAINGDVNQASGGPNWEIWATSQINYLSNTGHRPIKEFANRVHPSDKMYWIEAQQTPASWYFYGEMQVYPNRRWSRTPHASTGQYACYDGHVGTFTRDMTGAGGATVPYPFKW
jgi:prepilin-type N-terminal cleavage/methylation domain-containing protein